MDKRLRPLRISIEVAAALGLVSIHLSGEIGASWMIAGWAAWGLGFITDFYPPFQSKMHRFETAAVVGMIAVLLLDFFIFRQSIFIAITHFLLLFQIVKLLGEKARKDCLQIFLFSFFQILASCTLSVDPWHAAILLGLIPTATSALYWNQIARECEVLPETLSPDAQKNLRRMAALICAGALPLNALLTAAVFIIFPRLTLNAPLPGLRHQGMGYIDQVNLAQKGTLEQNASVVMWLSFQNRRDRTDWKGYLRGDVLNYFDGRQWSTSNGHALRVIQPDSNGVFIIKLQEPRTKTLLHSVMLADPTAATLFTIGSPLRVVAPLPALQENEGGSLHWISSWRKPLRYDVISETSSDSEIRPIHLEIPPMALKRIRDLAKEAAGLGSPEKQAHHLEEYLQKNYHYSTDLGDRISDNPIDTFLFERRQGPCAYFASSLAIMLRLRHIPSRLVAGYLKGQWNEPAQAYVIRQRDAHAWVEAYITGKGWISLDPTPRLTTATGPIGLLGRRLEEYGDYFGLLWNRFVIQYDLYSQMKAFENLKGGSDRLGVELASVWSKIQMRFKRPVQSSEGLSDPSAGAAPPMPFKKIGLLFFLALLSGIAWHWRRQGPYDSVIRFYGVFLGAMARAGIPKHPWETGREFAERLIRQKPDQAEFTTRITERYYLVRFKKESL